VSEVVGTGPPLPYGRQWIDDDDVAAVVECLRGDWLTQGPRVEAFEQALCEATGAKFAVAVSSGTAALHLAALACGIGPGDVGITSAITFTASANCVAYCGGLPQFADVDPETGLLDLRSLAERAEESSRAGKPPRVFVPVDFAGQSADLPAVRAIADRYGAKVISDAAHSLGGAYSWDGREVRCGSCTHSDAAILSFHPVKHVTTGEGGAVLTNDPVLASRVRDLRTHGIHRDPSRLTRSDEGPWYYEQDSLGYHYRISDLQCALGLSQIRKLRRFVERRNEIARMYDAAFMEPPFAGAIAPLRRRPATARHARHLYVVRLARRPEESIDSVAARRKALFLKLREKQIFAQVHYIPVPMQPYYGRDVSRCPKAAEFYAGCLSLPLFPEMTDADGGRVVDALKDWCEHGESVTAARCAQKIAAAGGSQ
jgi:UDP-4-amino-4,6-dideoxy-N-acetyl-beta-L-altrosamine transaminase